MRTLQILLPMLLLALTGFAQQKSITGTVSSAGKPLAGVSITVKGTNNGTTTDGSGNYSISAPPNSSLLFSYIGYTTKEVPVAGQAVLDVSIDSESTGLEKVVVTGYSSQ